MWRGADGKTDVTLADTTKGYRVLETSHPPTVRRHASRCASKHLCEGVSQQLTLLFAMHHLVVLLSSCGRQRVAAEHKSRAQDNVRVERVRARACWRGELEKLAIALSGRRVSPVILLYSFLNPVWHCTTTLHRRQEANLSHAGACGPIQRRRQPSRPSRITFASMPQAAPTLPRRAGGTVYV